MSSSINRHVSEAAITKTLSYGAPLSRNTSNLLISLVSQPNHLPQSPFFITFDSLSFQPIKIFNNFFKWKNYPRSVRVHPPPLRQLEHHVLEPPEHPRHQFHLPCHPLHCFHLMNSVSNTPLSSISSNS